MKLIASLTSPYARKVRVVLAEKRIECELEWCNPWEADNAAERLSPLAKVPLLVLDDEQTLFDSRVIVDYLDMVSPVGRLLAEGGRQRIMVKRWEALADGVCDAVVAVVLEQRRVSQQQDATWIARQQAKIAAGVAAIAGDLGSKNWCVGDTFTLADIAVGCMLGYLDLRWAVFNWRDAHPNLAKLFDKLNQRPAFRDTAPPVA